MRARATTIASIAALLLTTGSFGGREWVENDNVGGTGQDAGSTSLDAQDTTGEGQLFRIRGILAGPAASTAGGLTPGDFEDLYLICIDDPAAFMASTADAGGFATFDSSLYLFDPVGLGLLGNDVPQTFAVNGTSGFVGATLGNSSTDGTGVQILESGVYLLGITVSPRAPVSGSGQIFEFVEATEVSGPDGPGGGGSVIVWESAPTGACTFFVADDEVCQVVTEAVCTTLMGSYAGDGTVCPGMGACTFFEGSSEEDVCQVVTEAACDLLSGDYAGDGTECPGTGACVVSDKIDSCFILTQDICESSFGGTYLGDGTECVGACFFFPSGEEVQVCIETTDFDCLFTLEGEFSGFGTLCPGEPPSNGSPAGASRSAAPGGAGALTPGGGASAVGPTGGGEYVIVLQGCCFANQVPLGACILDTGECAVTTEFICTGLGGTWLGLGTDCAEPGWNRVDNRIGLTANQPSYWSALTGQPAGVSPFTILDPSPNPLLQGRPAPDGELGDRVLRGYVYAWAVDEQGREISWNHLKGDATLVNYRDGSAWEYNAWSFQDIGGFAPGVPLFPPYGRLDLDGTEYVPAYSQLLLDFYAAGSLALSGGGPFLSLIAEGDLTLHPVGADLRQENHGPITTKATFVVWNENETQFTGMHRCITCWDQTLLSAYADAQNHFLVGNLQTDKGKARIDGDASTLCSSNCCIPRPAGGGNHPGCASVDCQELVCQVNSFCCTMEWNDECVWIAVDNCDECDGVNEAAALLGVASRPLTASALGNRIMNSGLNLVGMGVQDAVIRHDLTGVAAPPPVGPNPPPNAADRVSGTEKGSLLIYSKVEVRWDAFGNVVQDTFLDLTNDWPGDVQVKMYFINGDPPIDGLP